MGRGRPSWPADQLALLGTDSDKRVAELLGRPIGTVVSMRRAKGIPALNEQRQRKWTKKELALLGTMRDADVARLTGRDSYSVHQARITHKIESWQSKACERAALKQHRGTLELEGR